MGKKLKITILISAIVLFACIALILVLPKTNNNSVRAELEYTLSEDGKYYIVSGLGECVDSSITIPKTYKNKPVKAIGSNSFEEEKITKIVIPEGVETISDNAFKNCYFLADIKIANSVTSIGKNAFYNCCGLTKLVIPDSVTTIDKYAFYGCDNLMQLVVGEKLENINSSAFYYCRRLVEIVNKSQLQLQKDSYNYEELGSYALYFANSEEEYKTRLSTNKEGFVVYTENDKKILINYMGAKKDIIIPDGITEINKYALYKNINISKEVNEVSSIVVPEGVIKIGYGSFYNQYVSKIILPETLEFIGEYAVFNCGNLTSITIPKNVKTIEEGAFDNCNRLIEVINKSDLVIVVGSEENGCAGLNATYVSHKENNYQTRLSTNNEGFVIYDDGERQIAVNYLGNSKILNISEGIDEINQYAFSNKNLYSVVIPDSVIKIGQWAFAMNDNLLKVVVGEKVEEIGYLAFNNQKTLEVINKSNLVFTKGSDNYGRIALDALNLANKEDATKFVSKLSNDKDGFIIYDDGVDKTIVAYAGIKNDIVIPDNIDKIGNYAFSENSTITSVVMKDNVKYLGEYSFYQCENLKRVKLNKTIKDIYRLTFYACHSLTEVFISSNITNIEIYNFTACPKLKKIIFEDPIGWAKYNNNNGNLIEEVDVKILSNPESAAKYLASFLYYEYIKK